MAASVTARVAASVTVSKITLPRVRPYQREVYESPARFKLLLCGRRWGKSKLALAAACDGHGPARGHRRGALQAARIAWIVPSLEHPAAAGAWADLKTALRPAATRVSEEHRRIDVRGGGSVEVWSGFNADTLRGPYFDGVVVDECSLQSERVWAAVRPTLSDYGGWAILCGTVPDDVTRHWLAVLHRYAASDAGRRRGWQTWRLPSWQNPQLTPDDLEEARETLGLRVYLREYGAELVAAAGGVWRETWFEGRYYDTPPPADQMQRVELFLDAAWKTGVRNDFSSCQVWGRSAPTAPDGIAYYLLGELHGRWESPELRRRVAAFRATWVACYPGQALPLVIESAGGGQVAAQEFRHAFDFPVVEFGVRGDTKMARNEAVSPLAEGGKVWLPSPRHAPWVRDWLDEIAGFPDLPHDDRCDAACMALQRLRAHLEPAREVLEPLEASWDGGPF